MSVEKIKFRMLKETTGCNYCGYVLDPVDRRIVTVEDIHRTKFYCNYDCVASKIDEVENLKIGSYDRPQ